jgi:long-chain acyl-CoA synthetase
MVRPRTLNELFLNALDRAGGRPAVLRARVNGTWKDFDAGEMTARIRDLAAALGEMGVRPADRVGILSENRPEWAIVDLACLAARCADVPVYPTLPAAQVEYILRDAGVVALFASTPDQVAKVAAARDRLPCLRHVVAFEGGTLPPGVLTLAEVLDRGARATHRHAGWRERALEAAPEDLATLIYTSGTTGEPKGVMLTHHNITSNVLATCEVLGVGERDECLSLLPLSHIFERMGGHYTMLHAGAVITYARSAETVSKDLVQVRPTLMLAVPRLYEKFHAAARDRAAASPVRRRLFRWAERVARQWADLALAGRPVPTGLRWQHRLAGRLVYARLRAAAGGRLRFFVSGGAPLSPDLARFFFGAGLPIAEGYGLTETSPVITVNDPLRPRPGSVGRPIPGVEVRIAEDGEVLTRGPHVMRGYYGKPEDTAEAIDPDGWFHTGDIGRLDADGFLAITDRKKDLIVTAGGKNVAPQPIETRLKSNPFIANAVVLGDRRKYPFALLVPEFGRLREWAAAEGIRDTEPAALLARPEVRAKLEMEARKPLRDLARFEVPKRFLLLERDFSIERGELTPKLSVRRRVVERHFADRIATLFGEDRDD